MKKGIKLMAAAACSAMLVTGVFGAYAAQVGSGQWCGDDENGWWYKLTEDGSTFLANTWYWIEDYDGVIRCYYFDVNGWLVKDDTVDGDTVDADGRWVSEGTVVTKDGTEVDYVQSVDFSALSQAAGSEATAQSTTTAQTTTSTGNASAYKATTSGDSPASLGESNGFESSVISGTSVSNSWAGYSMSLPGKPTSFTDGYTDWSYDCDDGETIYCLFKPLNGVSFDTFVANYCTSIKDGFAAGGNSVNKKGQTTTNNAVNTGTVNYGGLEWVQLRRDESSPTGSYSSWCYLRQVPGTDYVQIIGFENTDTTTDYSTYIYTVSAL